MNIIDSPPPGYEAFRGAQFFNHGYLPLAAAYCRRLGLVELVDQLVPSQMELRPGLAVQAMVLDTLTGRTPLYRLERFFEDQDIELLLGEKIPAHVFNDTNLGRSLDAIFEAGSSKILTELGSRATKTFKLDATTVSYDTTSTSVWGDYRACEQETPPSGPIITHGFSKDHRPDLKQFMTELLCVERGIPIFGRVLNGNSSDKNSNNELLSRISSIMAKQGLGSGAFLYVADSALVTGDNLEIINSLFVSRLPATYSACKKTVAEAVDLESWMELGLLAEDTEKGSRPKASYKAYETTVQVHEKEYRAVVIHSDSYERQQKKLDKALAKSEKEVTSALKKITTVYHCEADALKAAKKASMLTGELHLVETHILPFEVRQRGRPPKNAPPRTKTKYELQWEVVENVVAVERARMLSGCFVLLSNVPLEGDDAMDATCLLRAYKGQYGVESDFAFLKDPLVVNDTFLKKPQRIDALGMILVIALMIWRLMERSMRAFVTNTGKLLPGWENRRTAKPTSFMMSTELSGIQVVLTGDDRRIFMQRPRAKPKEYIIALGLDDSAFTNHHCKCRVIIPKKPNTEG